MQAQDSTHPTGVAEVSRGGVSVTRARERKASAALELKIKGHSWEQIAEELGYPTGRQALVAVERALEKQLNVEDKSKLRKLVGMRMETLLQSVWEKANDPEHHEHLAANGAAAARLDRLIKLYGLDAPTEMVVHTPTQSQLDAWVARVVSVQAGDVEEDDIVEGDWEDGDPLALQAGRA